MKKVILLLGAVAMTTLGIYSCQKNEADSPEKAKIAKVSCSSLSNTSLATEGSVQPCSTPDVYPLYAGNPANDAENKQIGTIKVFRDETYLYVQYSVTKEGWSLHLTHTFVGPCDEVPVNERGPIPGQFAHTQWGTQTEHADCGVTCWVEKFPLSSFAGLTCICLLTHAEAWKDCKPAETAWGGDSWGGNEIFPSKNWTRYIFCYEIPDCGGDN